MDILPSTSVRLRASVNSWKLMASSLSWSTSRMVRSAILASCSSLPTQHTRRSATPATAPPCRLLPLPQYRDGPGSRENALAVLMNSDPPVWKGSRNVAENSQTTETYRGDIQNWQTRFRPSGFQNFKSGATLARAQIVQIRCSRVRVREQ